MQRGARWSPTVLVIDDSRAARRLATAYLRQCDLQAITAASAEEGLELARAHRPDLVLCDVVLPGQDGYAFVSALRGDAELAETPVVLMSSVSAMQDRMRAVESGADDLLTKPFDQAELVSRVRALLRLKNREDALRQANAQLRERMYLMSTLFLVGNQLRESLDAADIYRIIRDTLVTIVGAHSFTIYLRDDQTPRFHLATSRGLAGDAGLDTLDPAGLPLSLATALELARPFVHDGPAATAPVFSGGGLPAALPVLSLVPLTTRGATVGVINVHAFAADRGDHPDFELLALLSSQVAGALHQARLSRQLQRYAADLEQADRSLREASKSFEEQMFHLKTLGLFSTQLHSTVHVPRIYEATRDLLVNFVGVSSFFISYFDQWEGSITYVGTADGGALDGTPSHAHRYAPLVQHIRETGTAFFRHARPDPAVRTLAERHDLPLPFACLPLVIDQHVQGVLVVQHLLGHKLDLGKEDYELLALLSQEATVALHNGYLHQHVERLSLTDSLTGAYNRRHFDDHLRAEVRRSRRTQHPLSLVLGDIDEFKRVNDQHGHPVGDHVLREIVRRLSRGLREVDEVARYGGEEFGIILPETAGEAAAFVAERVRLAVAATPVQAGTVALPITISLGVASLPPCHDELELVQAADEALLQAKRSGRNRVVVAPD